LAENQKQKGTIKFVFWTAASIAMVWFVAHSYASGQMTRWYYYRATLDGYAVNANEFKQASKEKPAVLTVGKFDEIKGLQAVPVKKGDRLPIHCNGIIGNDILKDGKRAKLEGDKILVTVPWQVKEAKGFKYKDDFKHKGIQTNPWSGVWNVAVVIGMGFCLGLMAEGFTDLLGWKIKKIDHYGH
jgi:hypothetical protein